ncbi:phosphoribosyl-AMP cyclohydrolase [Halobacteriales archaeon QS_3_64_16]|nr:MAG: phosphoribosyl-AMP cyclohydrolase [Halobacteriales archaeon QS_3_64_16]
MSEADATATTAPDVTIEFDAEGLVPVIAQEQDSGQVLMLAYANAEAITRTTETGLAHYYSRSREELWQKGKTSGNVQHVAAVRIDCDGDTLLYRVSQEGGACHTGHATCFYRSVEGVSHEGSDEDGDGGKEEADTSTPETLSVETEVVDDRVFDPAVYDE